MWYSRQTSSVGNHRPPPPPICAFPRVPHEERANEANEAEPLSQASHFKLSIISLTGFLGVPGVHAKLSHFVPEDLSRKLCVCVPPRPALPWKNVQVQPESSPLEVG